MIISLFAITLKIQNLNMNSFSFSGNSSVNILLHLRKILPGIERIVVIYDSELSGEPEIRYCDNSITKDASILFEGTANYKAIEVIRQKRSGFDWLAPGEEPFNFSVIPRAQGGIFEELDKTILCLRIDINKNRGLNNLFFLYFNKDLTHSGVNKSGMLLSTENKRFIRSMLEMEIAQTMAIWENDKKEVSGLISFMRNAIDDYKEENIISKNQRSDYGIYCLNEVNKNSDNQYIFSDLAIEKLRNYNGPLEKLKDMILDSVKFASLAFSGRSIITIDESMLRLNIRTDEKSVHNTKSKIFIRYADVAAYLDNFEAAVSELINEGIEVKSHFVGQRLKPKELKPAAISLSIKKRTTKIIYLMKNHRERWPLLRKHFKPIRNILKNEHDLLMEVS